MLRRTAIEAGEITLNYFEDSGYQGAEIKGDGSPVTQADQEAETFIKKALEDILPDIPMIGEELASEGKIPVIDSEKYYWMVDPLDGTKEFITGSGDYTVNIALIKNKTPILGVVYAPVKGELYAGCGPGTAIKWLEDTDKEKSIKVRTPPEKGLTVVASKSHGSGEKLDSFLKNFKVEKLIKRGSSLKICAVAAGKADIYPRFGPTCEWDTAAGDAVLRSAGGFLTEVNGKDFTYGKAGNKFLNPEFIASAFDIKTILEQDALLV
jgi:3'(2'), 5'-bisphosphate nucleotidase